MSDLDQIDRICEVIENKLNKRPNCSKCNDEPQRVDYCDHCGGSGIEPIKEKPSP